ncbi:hypothetical protein MCHI_000807 [Candidatus Magnetoovum chiemensis]|nr:hypothetical protein MCHI_000807 [Candidatus Magnetoovum chiemensis]
MILLSYHRQSKLSKHFLLLQKKLEITTSQGLKNLKLTVSLQQDYVFLTMTITQAVGITQKLVSGAVMLVVSAAILSHFTWSITTLTSKQL